MASAAVGIPILLYRRYWSKAWFWATALLLTIIQIPLVILARPLIGHAGSYHMLIFLMADGLSVIFVVSFSCPIPSVSG